MKNLTLLFTSLFLTISYYALCQERQDEVRQKLEFKIDSQSEILSQATGWSRIENSEGKFWKQSDNSLGYNSLPGRKLDFAFNSLQLIKFTIEGKCFYALCVVRPGNNQVAYYIFEENDYTAFPIILNIPEVENLPIFSIKWCKFGNTKNGNYYPDFDLRDKEMIRYLLLGKGSAIFYINNCEGYYAMNISCPVIKGDSLIRFNILADVRTSSGSKVTLPVENSYFEVKKQDFMRLVTFSPVIHQEVVSNPKEIDYTQLIRKYDKYYDSLNKYALSYYHIKDLYLLKNLPELKSSYKYFPTKVDSITNEKKFNIIVSSEGKVISAPTDLDLLKNIIFSPATFEVEYAPGYKKEYEVNCEVPVQFSKDLVDGKIREPNFEFVILKIKKSKSGLEIISENRSSMEFKNEIVPKTDLLKDFSSLENGKYYYYYERITYKYNVRLFMGIYGSRVVDAGYFFKKTDKKQIKIYNQSNPDPLLP